MEDSIKSLIQVGAGILVGVGIGVLVLAVLGLGSGTGFFSGGDAVLADIDFLQPSDGSKLAPDFELENLAGETVRLSGLRGQPVVINFWATWCGPCRVEMPLIQEYYAKYAPHLVVLAVNTGEAQDTVQAYADELNLTFEILLDRSSQVEKLYQVRGLPTTFFVNAEGNIAYQHIGLLQENQLAAYLDRIGAAK